MSTSKVVTPKWNKQRGSEGLFRSSFACPYFSITSPELLVCTSLIFMLSHVLSNVASLSSIGDYDYMVGKRFKGKITNGLAK